MAAGTPSEGRIFESRWLLKQTGDERDEKATRCAGDERWLVGSCSSPAHKVRQPSADEQEKLLVQMPPKGCAFSGTPFRLRDNLLLLPPAGASNSVLSHNSPDRADCSLDGARKEGRACSNTEPTPGAFKLCLGVQVSLLSHCDVERRGGNGGVLVHVLLHQALARSETSRCFSKDCGWCCCSLAAWWPTDVLVHLRLGGDARSGRRNTTGYPSSSVSLPVLTVQPLQPVCDSERRHRQRGVLRAEAASRGS